MATGIDRQCTLVSCFAEFDLLPDLLALPQDIELPGGRVVRRGFCRTPVVRGHQRDGHDQPMAGVA